MYRYGTVPHVCINMKAFFLFKKIGFASILIPCLCMSRVLMDDLNQCVLLQMNTVYSMCHTVFILKQDRYLVGCVCECDHGGLQAIQQISE